GGRGMMPATDAATPGNPGIATGVPGEAGTRAVATGETEPPAPGRTRVTVTITVNGTQRSAEVEARRTLADFLRQDLALTGTHLGCEHGVCGACTVLLDG